MRDRIKQLLINGLKTTDIASIVGCSPGYISQLVALEDFKKEIEIGRIELAATKTEDEHIDTRYKNLQHKLLNAMEGALGEASLGELTRAIEAVDKREDARLKRLLPSAPVSTTNINVVSLNLPQHAMLAHSPSVSLNSNQEIIAIDGKALAPMSSTGVKNLFAQITQKNQEIEDTPVKMLTVDDI